MSYSIFEETMADMTWPEVQKTINNGALVLLPTGVVEEHGPHMSLGVDTYLSHLTCKLTKLELEKKNIKALISPPFYWGINNVTGAFPGSFTVRKETMKAIINDILASLKRWGVNYVFNINWHDDYHHCITLLEAIKQARMETGIRAYAIISDILAKRLRIDSREDSVLIYKVPDVKQPDGEPDIHAGALETGAMAKYFPKSVDATLASKLEPTKINNKDFAKWRQGWSDAMQITPLGYLGNPSKFNPKKGEAVIQGISKNAACLIEALIEGRHLPSE